MSSLLRYNHIFNFPNICKKIIIIITLKLEIRRKLSHYGSIEYKNKISDRWATKITMTEMTTIDYNNKCQI